jgi:hypothetical protein
VRGSTGASSSLLMNCCCQELPLLPHCCIHIHDLSAYACCLMKCRQRRFAS